MDDIQHQQGQIVCTFYKAGLGQARAAQDAHGAIEIITGRLA